MNMIKSENAPSLCPRCINFTKGIDVGCRIGSYGLAKPDLDVQKWLREQSEESSWTYLGACPGFINNGSDPKYMPPYERRKFLKLLKTQR